MFVRNVGRDETSPIRHHRFPYAILHLKRPITRQLLPNATILSANVPLLSKRKTWNAADPFATVASVEETDQSRYSAQSRLPALCLFALSSAPEIK